MWRQKGFEILDNQIHTYLLDNQEYLEGLLEALGMKHGYANLPQMIDNPQYKQGWQNAQHERHCHNQETIAEFDSATFNATLADRIRGIIKAEQRPGGLLDKKRR